MLPNTVGTAVDGGVDRAAGLNLAQDFRFRGRSGPDDSADKEVIFDPKRTYQAAKSPAKGRRVLFPVGQN